MQLGDALEVATALVEDRGVHRPASSTRPVPRSPRSPAGSRQLIRVWALRFGDPLTPVGQARRGRTASSSSDSPHATFHRRSHRTASAHSRLRQLGCARLQRSTPRPSAVAGNDGRHDRRRTDRSVLLGRANTSAARAAAKNANMLPASDQDDRPPRRRPTVRGPDPPHPCTPKIIPGAPQRSPAAHHPPRRDFQRLR